MLLRVGLALADRVAAVLPARLAYGMADLAGDAWHRLAPDRRRLVAANLARVLAATGRPSSGPPLARAVRAAFRNHARYYLELVRAPNYPPQRIDDIVDVPDWESYEPALRDRAAILVSWHLGNFEPFGIYLAVRGFRPLAPVEEIEPPELYEFIAARRGAGGVDIVPLAKSRRALVDRLKDRGLVAIIGDRDLTGDGQPVTIFGHPTTMAIGPAWLAVNQRASLVAGRCLRLGPDRFRVVGTVLEVPDSGDRRADVRLLVERLADALEHDIAEAPEQWWGAFQPFWPDLRDDI
jgi:phosphatidylinositol dimannoside acyltransferase